MTPSTSPGKRSSLSLSHNSRASSLTRFVAFAFPEFLGTRPKAVRVSFGSLMVQRDQWDTYWGPKKLIS